MPLYEYECRSCGRRTELLQRFSDEPLSVCPECGGEVRKLPSAPAVQFKGTGWYVTDYGRGGANGSRSEAKSTDGDAGDGGKGAGKDAGKSTGEKSAKPEKKTASVSD